MDDASDIIDRLCTFAGEIMEDFASIAILRDAEGHDGRIEAIAAAGRDILTLAQAALVISMRSPSEHDLPTPPGPI